MHMDCAHTLAHTLPTQTPPGVITLSAEAVSSDYQPDMTQTLYPTPKEL